MATACAKPVAPGSPAPGRRVPGSPASGCRAPGCPAPRRSAAEAHLLQAVADHELGDHAAAVGWLRRALDLAAPEGYRRVFVEGGTPVRLLLADHLHWDSTHHLLATPAALVVPLSEREQVVLRYLSSRLSAGEIADELYVSLNTVKTQIKSIYRSWTPTAAGMPSSAPGSSSCSVRRPAAPDRGAGRARAGRRRRTAR
jgi:LuxR family transcriptional regulator, maltose regulon positive regulatory protein